MSERAYVDLHCHSTASDGTLAPAEVVRLAKEEGLSGLALTDHDTVDGVAEAAAEAERLGIDFLPGIEISAEYPSPGTMHLLGYGVDPENPALKSLTTTLLAGRDDRNPRIVAKLNEMGVHVSMQEWQDEAKGSVLGRPQLAAILHRKGYVSSIKQAFDKYLGQGAPAYVDKERLSPKKAIEMIGQSGGVAVLAHPVQLRTQNDAQLETVVKDLVDLGLQGIEVLHSDHDEALVKKYSALADRFGLLKTGGSDFHGDNKSGIELGTANGKKIPREFFDALKRQVWVNEINRRLEGMEPHKIMEWAVSEFADDIVMSSSFGAESAVMLHLAHVAKPDIKIIFVNTGYLFPETHQFMEELRKRFNLNVWTYRTRNDPIAYLQKAGEDNPAMRRNRDACCAVNKEEPFARALKELKPRAWLRGIRGNQNKHRAGAQFIEWSARDSCYVISPLLRWTGREIHAYLKKHDLPYHPLWEKGYLSIGCNPLSCTQPVGEGEDPRSGRWAGQDKIECGINVTNNSLDSANL